MRLPTAAFTGTFGFFDVAFVTLPVPGPFTSTCTLISPPTSRSAAAARSCADSLFTIIDEPDEVDSGTITCENLRGDVEFRNVSFSYGDESGPVLENISFSVEAGKTVAIVGHSGSGKTTLASLLPRFYNITGGEILLDGVPIGDYRLGSLRDNISMVSQDVVLFDDTIANNLAYGELRRSTDEDVRRAAEIAVNRARADRTLGLAVGSEVVVEGA